MNTAAVSRQNCNHLGQLLSPVPPARNIPTRENLGRAQKLTVFFLCMPLGSRSTLLPGNWVDQPAQCDKSTGPIFRTDISLLSSLPKAQVVILQLPNGLVSAKPGRQKMTSILSNSLPMGRALNASGRTLNSSERTLNASRAFLAERLQL